jgi:hypothetical protein
MEQEIKTYLTDNIAFRLDEEMTKGLERYFELAGEHDLIDADRPLRFMGS